jgi:hypothetical protein
MVQPLQVRVGLRRTFAAKPIQRPKQEYVEPPSRGVGHHRVKLSAIGLPAGFVVLVLDDNGSVLSRAEFAELLELVGCLLAFVASRDACVQGGTHRKPPATIGLAVTAAKTPRGQMAAKVLKASRLGSQKCSSNCLSPFGSRSVSGRYKIESFHGPTNDIDPGTTVGFSRVFNSQPPIERASAIFAVSGLAFR